MKKFGWGILSVSRVLLIWNTRVAMPSSVEAIGFDLWAGRDAGSTPFTCASGLETLGLL